MKSFELQIHRGGSWKTDSIYDDRQLAEIEARRLDGGRYDKVRIVEEHYDDETRKTSYRTIYRDSKTRQAIDEKIKDSRKTAKSPKSAAKLGGDPTRRRGRPPRARRKPVNLTIIVINTGLIGLFCIAALIGLQYFFQNLK